MEGFPYWVPELYLPYLSTTMTFKSTAYNSVVCRRPKKDRATATGNMYISDVWNSSVWTDRQTDTVDITVHDDLPVTKHPEYKYSSLKYKYKYQALHASCVRDVAMVTNSWGESGVPTFIHCSGIPRRIGGSQRQWLRWRGHEPSTSGRNLVSFDPVTPEFTRLVCVLRSGFTNLS